MFFKVTLTGYGYTFVAKGAQLVDEHNLFSEGHIYAHMSELQGIAIPSTLHHRPRTPISPCQLCNNHQNDVHVLRRWKRLHSLEGNQWPGGVDIDIEVGLERVPQELSDAGVNNQDIRG